MNSEGRDPALLREEKNQKTKNSKIKLSSVYYLFFSQYLLNDIDLIGTGKRFS